MNPPSPTDDPLGLPRMRSPLNAAGEVFARDVLCRGCGYNLRGLAIFGRCPECNHDNREALLPNDLRFMDPGWLERVLLGLRLVFAGLGLLWTPVPGTIVFSLLLGVFGVMSDLLLTIVVSIIFGLTAIGWLGLLAGAILATSPNPRIDVLARGLRIRLLTRYSAAVLLAATILIATFMLAAWPGPPGRVVGALGVIVWLAAISGGYGIVSWLDCLLAHDSEQGRMQSTVILQILVPVAFALPVGVALSGTLGSIATIAPLLVVLLLIALPVAVVLLTVEVWHVKERIRTALRLRHRRAAHDG